MYNYERSEMAHKLEHQMTIEELAQEGYRRLKSLTSRLRTRKNLSKQEARVLAIEMIEAYLE